MRVVPIASTVIRPEGWNLFQELGFDPYSEPEANPFEIASSDMEILPEFAGRTCYQSFPKPNPATATNKAYLANTVDEQEHESILEHSSVSFYVSGVSRNLLLELERHRHLSFSVISTRYVSPDKMGFALHPNTPEGEGGIIEDTLEEYCLHSKKLAASLYDYCRKQGMEVKQAREVARQVLPGNLETKFVVTGNLRAWRYVIRLRWHPKADKEIQNFAAEVLRHLKNIAPNSVQNFPHPDDIDN